MRSPDRRTLLRRAAAAATAIGSIADSSLSFAGSATTLTLPLLDSSGGGVLTIGVVIDGEVFRAIVDSGSPYLVVPLERDCSRQSPRLSYFGCASQGQFRASSFPITSEQYGALQGQVTWLRGDVSFGEELETSAGKDGSLLRRLRFDTSSAVGGELVFGGADRAVMSQSGGALLGLIRRVNKMPGSTIPAPDLRPTTLEQLQLSSFRIDAPGRTLTLSNAPLIAPASAVSRGVLPLIDPRTFGDGVEHISCRVDGDVLMINGRAYTSTRPILCVFDTGLTGVVFSQSLVDELRLARSDSSTTLSATSRLSAPNLIASISSLSLSLRTERGEPIVLRSGVMDSPLFYVQAISLDWFSCDPSAAPHVVAIGQCILGKGVLTVDGPQMRALWAPA